MIMDVFRYAVVLAITAALLFSGFAAWQCARILTKDRNLLIRIVITSAEDQAMFMGWVYGRIPGLDEQEFNEMIRRSQRRLNELKGQIR